jgi:DUF438 domain-containing protein
MGTCQKNMLTAADAQPVEASFQDKEEAVRILAEEQTAKQILIWSPPGEGQRFQKCR